MRVTVGAVALALALTACAGTNGGDTGDNGAAIDPTATLRFGSQYGPESFDPIDATAVGFLPFLIPLYDRLLTLDSEMSLQPQLATEWEYVDDATALELKLRDDVDFHDGSHFDASVAKANLDRAIAEGSPAVKANLSSIAEAVVVDDYTLRLNLKPGTGSDLPLSLASYSGLMVSPLGLESESLDYEPAGSGPYELVEGTFRQSDTVTFARSEDPYWGGGDDTRPAELVLTAYTDQNALLNALQSGQIDIVMTEPNARMSTFEEDDAFQVRLSPGGYYTLQTNLAWEGVSDVRVRQALSYALDREAISEGVMFGSCTPTAQPLTPFMEGYVAELDNRYPYDPDKARELLAEAGYADGLNLPGLYVSVFPYDGIATAVQAMLAEVGVTAEFTTSSIAEVQHLWSNGSAALHTPGATFRGDSAVQLLSFVKGSALPGGTSPEIAAAAVPLADPKVQGAERLAALEATNRAVVETVPHIVICMRQKVVIAADYVAGIDNIPSVLLGSYDTQFLSILEH